jgi:hypothetical protein
VIDLLALPLEELEPLLLEVGVTERLALGEVVEVAEVVALPLPEVIDPLTLPLGEGVAEPVLLELREEDLDPLSEEVIDPLTLPLAEGVAEPVLLELREEDLDPLEEGVTERLPLGEADREAVAVAEAETLLLEEAVIDLLELPLEELDTLEEGVTERLPLGEEDREVVTELEYPQTPLMESQSPLV